MDRRRGSCGLLHPLLHFVVFYCISGKFSLVFSLEIAILHVNTHLLHL
jgi:hypothetical protein